MQTMTKIIINAKGQEETWLDKGEAADYIGRSRSLLPDALRRYHEQTGKEIEELPDGNRKLVKQTDMNELIKVLYPFLARQKGLI